MGGMLVHWTNTVSSAKQVVVDLVSLLWSGQEHFDLRPPPRISSPRQAEERDARFHIRCQQPLSPGALSPPH